jgi:hypothetical protein
MFERTSLRRPSDITQLGSLDLGALAESLIFYSSTALILDPGSLTDLLQTIGPDSAVRLARDDAVRAYYLPGMTTIPNAGDVPAAGWGIATATTADWEVDRVVPKAFFDVIGRSGAARRASTRFLGELEVLTPEMFRPQTTGEIIDEVVNDAAVAELLKYVVPGYEPPDPMIFAVEYDETAGFSVETNLNLPEITAAHQAFYATTNEVTVSHLILTLVGVQEDRGLSALLDSDITLTPLRSALLGLRTPGPAVRASGASGRLQEFVFNDSRAISEA